MKVRNGFVSNSSSSSFIVDAIKYTCVDVAIGMIEDWLDQKRDYDYIDLKEYNELKKLYTDRLNNLEDKNTGIFIQDGDDIEISKKGNKIYVEASNNVEWNIDSIYNNDYEEYERKTLWYFPQVDNKHLGEFTDYDNVEWIEKKYGKKWLYRCENNKCDHQMRYLLKEGHVFCPNCMVDPNGHKVSFRKEKIERLLGEK